MKKILLFATLACLFVLASSSVACPASYVKMKANEAENSALRDKCHQISDKYLTDKGVDPTSTEGQAIEPYVIGTTWVDHTWAVNAATNGWTNSIGHRIDTKSVDECVLDAHNCSHHTQHFGDGQRIYQNTLPPQRAKTFGG